MATSQSRPGSASLSACTSLAWARAKGKAAQGIGGDHVLYWRGETSPDGVVQADQAIAARAVADWRVRFTYARPQVPGGIRAGRHARAVLAGPRCLRPAGLAC